MNRFIRLVSTCIFACTICLLGASHAFAETLIDINSASAQTLAEQLPGVGPKKAKAIVAYREQHGGFVSIDALVQVKGIGPGILKKIRSLIQAQAGALKNLQAANSGSAKRELAAQNAVQSVINRAKKDAAQSRVGKRP